MAAASKLEFPPLLGPGMHDICLPNLRQLCVDGFPLSKNRGVLMGAVEAVCVSLSTALIPSHVWVDGSFLTQKIEPADVDLAVRIHAAALPNPGADQLVLMDRIAKKQFAGCDSFLFVEYPSGHPQHAIGDMMRAYWQRQFGFTRTDKFKGVAIVRTPLT
jgi:hypothetical protein